MKREENDPTERPSILFHFDFHFSLSNTYISSQIIKCALSLLACAALLLGKNNGKFWGTSENRDVGLSGSI
jgi:hypothetical protein